MYTDIQEVINRAEQFDKDCTEDNFPSLVCRECPVLEACNEVSKGNPNQVWPAEMLAAYQAKLSEDLEKGAKVVTPEALRQQGISFDVALPQTFWDEIYQKTGQNPFGLVVWAYLPGDAFGQPVAVHAEGVRMLEEAGYEQPELPDIQANEDPDQPGRFYYLLNGEGSDISYDSREEALRAAWRAAREG